MGFMRLGDLDYTTSEFDLEVSPLLTLLLRSCGTFSMFCDKTYFDIVFCCVSFSDTHKCPQVQ